MSAKSIIFAHVKKTDPHSLLRPVVWLCRFRHRCGYGVHSPFAFKLITEVFYERGEFYAYAPLAAMRRQANPGLSERTDRLLLRLTNDVQPRRVALWGDALGMTRLYVEAGSRRAEVTEIGSGSLSGLEGCDMLLARRPPHMLTLFDEFARQAPDRALCVIEGIHRNRQAAREWQAVKRHPRTTVSFDLYELGLVFLHPTLNRQHYIVNF